MSRRARGRPSLAVPDPGDEGKVRRPAEIASSGGPAIVEPAVELPPRRSGGERGPVPEARTSAPDPETAVPPEESWPWWEEEAADASFWRRAGFGAEDLFGIARRHWRLFLALVAASLPLGFLDYSLRPKRYRAETVIEISRRAGFLGMNELEMLSTAIQDSWSSSFFPTQHRLLRSRGLAERAVRHLGLHGGTDGSEAPGAIPAPDLEVAALAEGLLAHLEVEPIADTHLVELRYEASTPEEAARVLNGLVETYISWGIEFRSNRADHASDLLDSQIATLQREIREKESALDDAGESAGPSDGTASSAAFAARLDALNRDLAAAIAARVSSEASLGALERAPPELLRDRFADAVPEPVRLRVRELEKDHARQLEIYTPEWPALRALSEELEEARAEVDEEVDRAIREALLEARVGVETARLEEQALSRQLASLEGESRQRTADGSRLRALRTELSIRRGLLDTLVGTRSKAGIAARLEGNGESNVRVVDVALPPRAPVRPSLSGSLAAYGVAGVALAFLAVFLVENFDRSVRRADQLEEVVGFPVLGVLPEIPADEARRIGATLAREPGAGDVEGEMDGRRSSLVALEALRGLRSALMLSSPGALRSFGITSARPGEGKSFTAARLAGVFARLETPVLLVDADLRRPTQHEIFGVSNRRGLAEYLASDEEFTEVVQPTAIPDLYLVPAGPRSPSPAELLASSRMEELLAEARERFEVVIVDTPPVLSVTDAELIGSRLDGMLVCVQAGSTTRRELRTARDRILLTRVRILGYLLNRDPEVDGRYYAYDESGAGSWDTEPSSA